MQIKTKIVSCHAADSKPVKQEVNGTVTLPPLVFPGPTSLKNTPAYIAASHEEKKDFFVTSERSERPPVQRPEVFEGPGSMPRPFRNPDLRFDSNFPWNPNSYDNSGRSQCHKTFLRA